MTREDWNTPWAKAIAMFLSDSDADVPDDGHYIAFNPHSEPIPFVIPLNVGRRWRFLVCTAGRHTVPSVGQTQGTVFCVESHSLVIASRAQPYTVHTSPLIDYSQRLHLHQFVTDCIADQLSRRP